MPETQTPLSYYLRDRREFVCLGCTLPICADTDAGCIYKLEKDLEIDASRRYYTDKYYPSFRSKEIARVTQWQKENKDKLAAAQKRYQQANREKINARRREKRKLTQCTT